MLERMVPTYYNTYNVHNILCTVDFKKIHVPKFNIIEGKLFSVSMRVEKEIQISSVQLSLTR